MPAALRRPDLHHGRPRFVNSGKFTPTLVTVLCAALLAISWERGRGNFHRLTNAVLPGPPPPARSASGPGGEQAIELVRTANATGQEPELLRATLLPGRGMNVLQLTARLPGHEEVPLLFAPPLPAATGLLNGTGPDTNGTLSATVGGAFLVPWAGHLVGKPASTRPGMLQTLWLGQHLTFPAFAPGSPLSTLGLLLDRGADHRRTEPIADGRSAEADFHPGNWPSTFSVHILAALTAHTLDLTTTVENTGSSPMPAGAGWMPYFAIPSGDRAHATLYLPAEARLETSRETGLPDGRLLPTHNSPLDFAHPGGLPLGHNAVDETFVHLKPDASGGSPAAELRDTASGYGLRLTPLTPAIRAFRVIAPAGKPWVALGPYTNVDDALGPQWTTGEGSGIVTLQPGESLQWKVRLEVFSLRTADRNPIR